MSVLTRSPLLHPPSRSTSLASTQRNLSKPSLTTTCPELHPDGSEARSLCAHVGARAPKTTAAATIPATIESESSGLREPSTGKSTVRAPGLSPLLRCAPMNVVIWHNPSCSKSREALALLKERGYEPTVREYLKDPPSLEELRGVLKKLGARDPHALVRKKEKEYAELGVAKLEGDAVLRAMAEHPRLIERPVVITKKGARIGRPTESILEVLD